MTEPTATTWTLRFTEWACGHHQERPADIPVSSPEQAKAILLAIGHAISQPGHARACVFNETHGYDDIYVTDDYCEWEPAKRTAVERPALVLCKDWATVAALQSPEMKDAREDYWAVVDLTSARAWDGKEMLGGYDVALTVLTREQIDALIEEDGFLFPEDAHKAHFGLPPLFHDGAEVLVGLREEAQRIAEYEAAQQAEVDRDNAADLKREEQNLEKGQSNG